MSLSKRLKSNSIYESNPSVLRKDSFDRICDDLCEVLLSYLPIEDKIRLESVSKQFQRCLNKKQFKLYFSEELFDKLISNRKTIDVKKIESILKKFEFIDDISCHYLIGQKNTNQLLKSIVKCGKNLKTFQYLPKFDPKLIDKYFHKFGPKLESISLSGYPGLKFNYKSLIRKYFNSCIRLKDLHIYNIYLSDIFDENTNPLVKNLRTIYFSFRNEDSNLLEIFVKSNKSLENISFINNEMLNKESIDSLKNGFSQLVELKSLQIISFDENYFNNNFISVLKQIGLKCQNLTVFDWFELSLDSMDELEQILETISGFRSLKDFYFRAYFPFNSNFEFSSKSLNGLQSLSHLSLELYDIRIDNFFEDIDKHLPNLEYLSISFNYKLNTFDINSLAKLTKLKAITFLDVGETDLIITSSDLQMLSKAKSYRVTRSMNESIKTLIEEFF